MNIKHLSLSNYRNYKTVELDLSPKVNIFIGNNAAGKTNILEAIYTLALAKSYKAKDEDVISRLEEFYKIKAKVEHFNRVEDLIIIGTRKGKKVLKNEIEIKKLSDFIGLINVVLFSPDDIVMLKNGPQDKRKLIDLSLLQVSKKYVDDYNAFKKQLKLRNDYLKYLQPKIKEDEDINDQMLDVLTENFIECNKEIYNSRLSFIKKLEEKTQEKYRALSGENVSIKFEYNINFSNTLEFFRDKYKIDIMSGSTGFGCHRDDLIFYKDGLDFETNASQGELRMLALSIKLGFADVLDSMKGESPIVLLDDVLSELDKNHQNRLLKMLNKDMQIIITSTDILKLGKLALDNAKIYSINHKEIKETNINA